MGEKKQPSVNDLLKLKGACMDMEYFKRTLKRMIADIGVPSLNPGAPDRPALNAAANVTGAAGFEGLASSSRTAPYPAVNVNINRTGCARTEGFKMMRKDRPSLATVQKVRGNLCVRSSPIHGYGVFALAPITPDEYVAEYVGEIVRRIVARKRQMALPVSQNYMFQMEADKIIDATTRGNVARFINHSCDPNCFVKIVEFGGEKKLKIFAKGPIEANEELTIDYNFIPSAGGRMPCFCGAAQCRKYMY